MNSKGIQRIPNLDDTCPKYLCYGILSELVKGYEILPMTPFYSLISLQTELFLQHNLCCCFFFFFFFVFVFFFCFFFLQQVYVLVFIFLRKFAN